MTGTDLRKLLIFAVIVTAVWVAIFGLVEVLFLGGDLRGAVIRGLAGGIVFALGFAFFRRG